MIYDQDETIIIRIMEPANDDDLVLYLSKKLK